MQRVPVLEKPSEKKSAKSESASDPAKRDTPERPPRKRRYRRKPGKRVKTERKAPEKKGADLHAGWDENQFQVPAAEGKTRFHDFDLPSPLMHAIQDLGFEYCTPIQAEILPSTLSGRDATGRAQTGTGKTAAFLITIITRLLGDPLREKRPQASPRVLIMAPTRELVMQISKEAQDLSKYTSLNIISVFGGMD